MEWKEKLIARLRERRDLTHSDILSLSVALNHPTRAEAMLAFLEESPEADADAIFCKAGEIAFGKNA